MDDVPRSDPTRRFFALKEAARLYGVSHHTISAAIRAGQVCAYRLPGQRRLRLAAADLDSWIRSFPLSEEAVGNARAGDQGARSVKAGDEET